MLANFNKIAIAVTVAMLLINCGGSKKSNENTTSTGDSGQSNGNETVVIDYSSANETKVALDVAKAGINLSASKIYTLELNQEAEVLVISLAKDFTPSEFGDPDLYVKYGDAVSTDSFDCVSYLGSGTNEVCIIDKAQIGTYQILVDVAGDVPVSDGVLWASTSLLTRSQACHESLTIRGQALNSNDIDNACVELNETRDRFLAQFNDTYSPAPGLPVEGDLNDVTYMTVFSSLSNHTAWMGHFFNSDNRSGIYYETSPDDKYHASNIYTFQPLEWTGGRHVIRSLSHEYIHALDGRYLKEGGYQPAIGWWSEGLAEYLGTYYQKPYRRYEVVASGASHTLAEIFSQHENNGVPSPYDWGQLAVAYLIEQQPEQVNQLVSLMRAGSWDEVKSLQADWALNLEADFANWLATVPKQQFETSAKALNLNEFAEINGRGGWLFAISLDNDIDSLTIATSNTSGDLTLIVDDASIPHPHNENSAKCLSKTENTSVESCTLTNVKAGKYYATVDVDFAGDDVVDGYISACAGVDCSVALPAVSELRTFDTPVLPILEALPAANTFGGCELARAYSRDNTGASLEITNTTDVPVTIYWIGYSDGVPYWSNPYKTLGKGESYSADYWTKGDRLMIVDSANNCLGVAVLTETSNNYTINSDTVKNAVTEAPETGVIGSCDLLTPYSRTSSGAAIKVTNSAATPVVLHWVSNESGVPYLDSNYGVLSNGSSYEADYWKEGDRMMLADQGGQCLGVVILNAGANTIDIDASFFQ